MDGRCGRTQFVAPGSLVVRFRPPSVLQTMTHNVPAFVLPHSSLQRVRAMDQFTPVTERVPNRSVVMDSKEAKPKKIPRPKNAFMLFSNDFRKKLLQTQGFSNNQEVSVKLGEMWKSLPQEVKQTYHERAQQEVELHRIKYPDYKYQPRQRKGRVRLHLNEIPRPPPNSIDLSSPIINPEVAAWADKKLKEATSNAGKLSPAVSRAPSVHQSPAPKSTALSPKRRTPPKAAAAAKPPIIVMPPAMNTAAGQKVHIVNSKGQLPPGKILATLTQEQLNQGMVLIPGGANGKAPGQPRMLMLNQVPGGNGLIQFIPVDMPISKLGAVPKLVQIAPKTSSATVTKPVEKEETKSTKQDSVIPKFEIKIEKVDTDEISEGTVSDKNVKKETSEKCDELDNSYDSDSEHKLVIASPKEEKESSDSPETHSVSSKDSGETLLRFLGLTPVKNESTNSQKDNKSSNNESVKTSTVTATTSKNDTDKHPIVSHSSSLSSKPTVHVIVPEVPPNIPRSTQNSTTRPKAQGVVRSTVPAANQQVKMIPTRMMPGLHPQPGMRPVMIQQPPMMCMMPMMMPNQQGMMPNQQAAMMPMMPGQAMQPMMMVPQGVPVMVNGVPMMPMVPMMNSMPMQSSSPAPTDTSNNASKSKANTTEEKVLHTEVPERKKVQLNESKIAELEIKEDEDDGSLAPVSHLVGIAMATKQFAATLSSNTKSPTQNSPEENKGTSKSKQKKRKRPGHMIDSPQKKSQSDASKSKSDAEFEDESPFGDISDNDTAKKSSGKSRLMVKISTPDRKSRAARHRKSFDNYDEYEPPQKVKAKKRPAPVGKPKAVSPKAKRSRKVKPPSKLSKKRSVKISKGKVYRSDTRFAHDEDDSESSEEEEESWEEENDEDEEEEIPGVLGTIQTFDMTPIKQEPVSEEEGEEEDQGLEEEEPEWTFGDEEEIDQMEDKLLEEDIKPDVEQLQSFLTTMSGRRS